MHPPRASAHESVLLAGSLPDPCRLLVGLPLCVATSKSSENPRIKRGLALHSRIWAPCTRISSPIRCFFGQLRPCNRFFHHFFEKGLPAFCGKHIFASHRIAFGVQNNIFSFQEGCKRALTATFFLSVRSLVPSSRRFSRHGPFKDRILARDLCTFIVDGRTWS